MSMSKHTGGSTNEVILFTDLEPDDVMAIAILLKFGVNIRYVVVGEGNANIKVSRMRRYCELFGMPSQVIQGFASNKLFAKDGCEFSDLVVEEGVYNREQFMESISDFLEIAPNPVFICLKPPRELLDCFEELKHKLGLITGLFYGGFNFRTLISENAENASK